LLSVLWNVLQSDNVSISFCCIINLFNIFYLWLRFPSKLTRNLYYSTL
jgi:hypothetical protein